MTVQDCLKHKLHTLTDSMSYFQRFDTSYLFVYDSGQIFLGGFVPHEGSCFQAFRKQSNLETYININAR